MPIGIAMFVQVADSGSFSATARLLGLSSSAVGKSVARMEARLGARLFQRSTRHLALTDEGEKFLQRCKRILAEVEAAERELSASTGAPSGRLRISLPRYSGLFEPAIAAFMLAYPAIELDLDFSDAMVNVLGDGYDAVVRTGELADSGLTRRKLCTFRRLLVAAPAYLARHGRPLHPSDLASHQRPASRHMPPRLRVFIDFLVEKLQGQAFGTP
ncbi:LysR family transcriptional regulator [Janthinobacterium sp. HLX7-2]|uniref:LysR family transcriptional regulator n=1 Tax=Janthinobacterium sp. HLX7-2 TaxID=1259331 RepID=UPI003F21F378